MKKLWIKFLCKIGFHGWRSGCANFKDECTESSVAVIWWECPHCGANKLKFIGK